MKAWCAWCQEEGKPGFLGERPPLDDPSDTHGICDHHRTLLLAALPQRPAASPGKRRQQQRDRKSTRLNSSHSQISYAVFCLKKKYTLLVLSVFYIFSHNIMSIPSP